MYSARGGDVQYDLLAADLCELPQHQQPVRQRDVEPEEPTFSGSSADGSSVDEDAPCLACGSPVGEDCMLLCDGCNKGWHLHCLQVCVTCSPDQLRDLF